MHRELAWISLLECVNCSNSTAQLIHTVRAPSLHPPAPQRVGHIHLLYDGKGTKAASYFYFFCYIPAAYTFTVVLFSPSELFSCRAASLDTHPSCKTDQAAKYQQTVSKVIHVLTN